MFTEAHDRGRRRPSRPPRSSLAGCASDGGGDTDGGGRRRQPYVALVSKGFQHQFWQAVKAGAEQAGRGVRRQDHVRGPQDTEADVDQQIQMLQTALDKNPAAVGFAASTARPPARCMQQAKDAGIPVIAFDSGVDSDVPLTTAATDNLAAAAEAAKHMAEADRPRGQDRHRRARPDLGHRRSSVATASSTTWRRTSRTSRSSTSSTAAATSAKSADLAKAIIAANPDLKGIYGSNEGSAIGVVQAVQGARHRPGASSSSSASTPARPRSTRSSDGLMVGAITQNPVGIGYETVKAAVEAINGEDAAEDDRHRLLLVRHDEHRRRRDPGRALRVGARMPRRGRRLRPAPPSSCSERASAATARRRSRARR